MKVRAAGRATLRRVGILAVKLALLAVVIGFVAVALYDAARQADWSKLFFRPEWILLGLGLIAGGVVSWRSSWRCWRR